MNRLNKIAASVALICACGAAHALDVTASGAGAQTFDAGVLSDVWTLTHNAINGNFSDTITFSLPSVADFSYSANTLYLKSKTDITPFTAYLDVTALTVTASGKFEFSSGEFNLANGVHTIKFGGTGMLAQGGAYQFEMSAAPVPEPDSWALLLAGFGVMGAIARRRSKWMAK